MSDSSLAVTFAARSQLAGPFESFCRSGRRGKGRAGDKQRRGGEGRGSNSKKAWRWGIKDTARGGGGRKKIDEYTRRRERGRGKRTGAAYGPVAVRWQRRRTKNKKKKERKTEPDLDNADRQGDFFFPCHFGFPPCYCPPIIFSLCGALFQDSCASSKCWRDGQTSNQSTCICPAMPLLSLFQALTCLTDPL